jgi:hypothetical protein
MNTEFYRLLGFLDVVSNMLDKKELVIRNVKRNPVSLGRQLAGARRVLLTEALKMQRASAEFEAKVKPARAIISEVMQLLRTGASKLSPSVAAHLEEYSHSDRFLVAEDCSTSTSSSSSSSSSGKPRGCGEDCSTKKSSSSSS